MNTSIPYHEVVKTICVGCHSNSDPSSIVVRAQRTLQQLNITRGYFEWFKLNQDGISSEEMAVRQRFIRDAHDISMRWHEFNLDEMEKDATNLLSEIGITY